MIFPSIPLITLAFLAGKTLADRHRLCACENSRGSGVDDARTIQVVQNNGNLVYSTKFWQLSDGSPHPGYYAHAVPGDVSLIDDNGYRQFVKDDGFLGGEEFHKLCAPEGAPQSTCFTPKNNANYAECGGGYGGCSSKWGTDTDEKGVPKPKPTPTPAPKKGGKGKH